MIPIFLLYCSICKQKVFLKLAFSPQKQNYTSLKIWLSFPWVRMSTTGFLSHPPPGGVQIKVGWLANRDFSELELDHKLLWTLRLCNNRTYWICIHQRSWYKCEWTWTKFLKQVSFLTLQPPIWAFAGPRVTMQMATHISDVSHIQKYMYIPQVQSIPSSYLDKYTLELCDFPCCDMESWQRWPQPQPLAATCPYQPQLHCSPWRWTPSLSIQTAYACLKTLPTRPNCAHMGPVNWPGNNIPGKKAHASPGSREIQGTRCQWVVEWVLLKQTVKREDLFFISYPSWTDIFVK